MVNTRSILSYIKCAIHYCIFPLNLHNLWEGTFTVPALQVKKMSKAHRD